MEDQKIQNNFNVNNTIENIQNQLKPLLLEVNAHPVYEKIKEIEDLQIFLEHHVYAVWDFMSLLKYLQVNLTCITIPWTPTDNPVTRQFINEIVLAEESDIDYSGKPASHFEQYIDGMMGCNADTSEVYHLIDEIEAGTDVFEAIDDLMIADEVKAFLRFTFELIQTNELHKVAASFAFAREGIIPDMFTSIVKNLNKEFPGVLVKFIYYLERHIELDGDSHGPIAMHMIEELCGNDDQKWKDCFEVAEQSLKMRMKLWDAISDCIDQKESFNENEMKF